MYKKIFLILIGLCLFLYITAGAEPSSAKPITKEPVKITLELTNVPITTAITQIARAGDFSVVISPEVSKTIITATFKNVPAELALQTICDAAGLAIQQKESDVYLITPKTLWDADFSEMMKEMAKPAMNEMKRAISAELNTALKSSTTIQTCPICKKQFKAATKADFCPYCGAEMLLKCKSCGKVILSSEWSYCPYCGKKIEK